METDTPATGPSPDESPIQDLVGAAERPTGPHAAPVVLGLVALVLAALTILSQTMGLRVDWSQLGPAAFVGIGLLLVVIGAVGLVRRHDDP